MYLKLRILFTILATICLVVVFPAGFLGGTVWFGVFGGGAFLFFALMLLCKQAQEKKESEEAEKNKEPEPDFLNPKNENTKIDE